MSSTVTSFPSARRTAIALRNCSASEVMACVAPALVAVALARASLHPHARDLTFYCFVVTFACGAAFAGQLRRNFASPLDIDVSVRLVRSIVTGIVVVIYYSQAFSYDYRFAARTIIWFMVVSFLTTRKRRWVAECARRDLASRNSRAAASYFLLKRVIDVSIALMTIVLFAPLLALISAAIKLDSTGPVFFIQNRIGECGRSFKIVKFRSMHIEAAVYSRSPSDSHDGRITRLGRILRRLGVDELPQLINVIRGEMSLVGPRPEMPFIVDTYSREQRERLNAVPGITGLWQISPARALPIHLNMQYDLYYISHRSIMLDLAIVCRTASSVIRGVGAV